MKFFTLLAIAILAISAMAFRSWNFPEYKITFTGRWEHSEKMTVLKGVDAVGQAMAKELGSSPPASFEKVFGPIEFRATTAIGGYYGMSWGNVILIRPEKVTEKLIVHELGHTFNDQFWPNEVIFSPVFLLEHYGIYSPDGQLITGPVDGTYQRDNFQAAPENGYYSDNYRKEFQWHPKTLSGGNSASEDWADMFMNWVYRSFVPNKAGDARNSWINARLPLWLAECKHGH